jgi:hypothetical protein
MILEGMMFPIVTLIVLCSILATFQIDILVNLMSK